MARQDGPDRPDSPMVGSRLQTSWLRWWRTNLVATSFVWYGSCRISVGKFIIHMISVTAVLQYLFDTQTPAVTRSASPQRIWMIHQRSGFSSMSILQRRKTRQIKPVPGQVMSKPTYQSFKADISLIPRNEDYLASTGLKSMA